MDTTPLLAPSPEALPEVLDKRFLEPPGFRWGYFTARDGARLRWGHLAAGSALDCIVVGGFLEFVEKYFELLGAFQERGLNVWFLEWRGQGRSVRSGTRPTARVFAQDADDLAQFITTVSPHERTRLLVAHSMGAAISLIALHEHPGIVKAAILSAPMLEINTGHIPHWVARLLAGAMTAIGRGDDFVPGAGPWPYTGPAVSNDPVRGQLLDAWFRAQEDLRLDGPTYAWLNAAFSLTARTSDAGFLSAIKTPILMGSAGEDLLVVPAAHGRAARLLPNCRLVTFAQAKHELFHETDAVRARWFAAIDAFIAQHLSPEAKCQRD